MRFYQIIPVLVIALGVSACASRPPPNPENLCNIFKQKSSWHKAALKAKKRWGGPIHVSMAIMRQESAFVADAKPPVRFFLGVIPYGRASNAYGYAQALDSTWEHYRAEAGGFRRQRDDYADAIDFIHWYMHKTWKINKVSKWDAKNQYLNYHEGQGGYARGTWKKKKWLIKVSDKVASRARQYLLQYKICEKKLPD